MIIIIIITEWAQPSHLPALTEKKVISVRWQNLSVLPALPRLLLIQFALYSNFCA